MFNETLVLQLTYICYFYTEHVEDADMVFNIGWFYSLMMFLLVVVNLGFMVKSGIYLPIRKIFCAT
jgi:hypothetical protein